MAGEFEGKIIQFPTRERKPEIISKTLDFERAALDAIHDLAVRDGIDDGAALSKAIGVATWYANLVDDGGRVLQEKDGAIHEVLFYKPTTDKHTKQERMIPRFGTIMNSFKRKMPRFRKAGEAHPQ